VGLQTEQLNFFVFSGKSVSPGSQYQTCNRCRDLEKAKPSHPSWQLPRTLRGHCEGVCRQKAVAVEKKGGSDTLTQTDRQCEHERGHSKWRGVEDGAPGPRPRPRPDQAL